MRPGFGALYLATLTLSVGSVELARLWHGPPLALLPEQPVAEVLAVPPKPDGAQAPTGAGEGEGYTEEGCRAARGPLREACFHTLALQRAERDPQGALLACAELPEGERRMECVADVAELHSTVDRDAALALCPSIPRKKWRDQCVFGIAMAWSRRDYAVARALCDQAGQWRDFCRHDVNGEIAQVDPEEALRFCLQESGTALQNRTCYHGLGKYLGRTDPATALAICDRVPPRDPLHRQNCYHGLGWALAETSPDAALASCRAEAGAYGDSCRLGVSANLKRFDVERAAAVCAEVGDATLRRRCEVFVER